MQQEDLNNKIDNINCLAVLKHHLAKWLNYLQSERRLSYNTCKNYLVDITQFINFMSLHYGFLIGVKDLEEIEFKDFRGFLFYLNKQNVGKVSTNRKISCIKNFYKYLKANKIIEKSNIDLVTSVKTIQKLPRPLEHETILNSIKEAEKLGKQKWEQERNKVLFIVMYGCGLRISEMLNLKIKDLPKQNQEQVVYIKGKGNKERLVPFPQYITDYILNYLNLIPINLQPKDYIFVGKQGGKLSPRTVQNIVEKVRIALFLDKSFTPHALRHSFATRLLEEGGDLKDIQQLLGHSSLSSTQRYVKLDNLKLKENQKIFHPRSTNKN